MDYLSKFLNDPDSEYDTSNPKLIYAESDIIIAIGNKEVQYSDLSSGLLEWKSGPNFFKPPGCFNSKIVAFDNKFLFSIGGFSCYDEGIYTATNKVYILDLSISSKRWWIQTTSMISSRCEHAVCIHNNRIFAVGGVDEQDQRLNTIEVFDINTKKWTLYCTMLNARDSCSAIYYNNFLYIIGGRSENHQILSTVECFNDLSKTWSNHISSLPQALYGTCITIYKNNLYVVGGAKAVNKYNSPQIESSNTIYKYIFQDSGWFSLPSLLNPRHSASCAVIDEKLYIFGGLNNNFSYVRSNEILDLENNSLSTQEISLNDSAQNIIILNKHK